MIYGDRVEKLYKIVLLEKIVTTIYYCKIFWAYKNTHEAWLVCTVIKEFKKMYKASIWNEI